MSATILVGAQWGDEGKGKIVDYLASQYDYVVRYQGGNNAGHTVIVGDVKLALHLVPSCIMTPGCTPVIGNGCVIDPLVLVDELKMLQEAGFATDHLLLSDKAHLILPYHIALDNASEAARLQAGQSDIGTTKRGIGPAYEDKISRKGIRLADMLNEDLFRRKIAENLAAKNELLTKIYGQPAIEIEDFIEQYCLIAKQLRDLTVDTQSVIFNAIKSGKKVLFEGAQGVMLDIDHGSYPFVTSSNTAAGGATSGSGVGPTMIDSVVGIAKAYTTRVGQGFFPVELTTQLDIVDKNTVIPQLDQADADYDAKVGLSLVINGAEFGTTTGRVRRCGWLDLVVLKYSAQVCGMTEISLTKLDVLNNIPLIKIATSYKVGSRAYQTLPSTQSDFEAAVPVYETMPGWNSDISGITNYADLPIEARNYIEFIESFVGVPINTVAVGPDRKQTIKKEKGRV